MDVETEDLHKPVEKCTEKKPRRRMKATYTKIREQMEFYFSDANLSKDRFLKKSIEATTDGYIALDVFLKCQKIKHLTDETSVIAKAILNKSDLLQINAEGTRVRRVTPIKEPVNTDERTVYVECLPHDVDHDWIKKVFSSCGKVVYVSLPRFPTTGIFKGFGFVEFETIEGAQAACKELNNPPAGHKVGMFPKSNHQLEALKKKLPEDQIKETQEKVKEMLTTGEENMETVGEVKQPVKKESSDNKASVESHKSTQSKRRRAKSENDIENSSDSSPAKRKKAEVSFDLPSEERKSTEEKTTPGSKKKSRKRKNKSRSAESEESKGESDLDKSDLVPEKKQKIVDKDKQGSTSKHAEQGGNSKRAEQGGNSEHAENSGKQGDNSKLAEGTDVTGTNKEAGQQNKENSSDKKKRFRRKKDKKEKEFPELTVLPKKEWLLLREEYLQLQKASMALLKKTLKEQTCINKKGSDDVEEPKRPEIKFIPDVIVSVSSEQPMHRKILKSALGDGYQIAYIDVKDEQTQGFIRCKDAASATSMCAAAIEGYKFTPVTGDEEKQYWDKLAADRETRLNTKVRHKKRGQKKLTDKAQKVSIENTEKKHIVFDDD